MTSVDYIGMLALANTLRSMGRSALGRARARTPASRPGEVVTGGWNVPRLASGDRALDVAAMRQMIRSPGVLLGSARASRRYDRARMIQFPVRATWRSRMRRDPGAVIRLGGRLFLGHWPDGPGDGVGPDLDSPPTLDVRAGGRFTTGGWVIIGAGSEIVVGAEAEVHIGGGSYCTAEARVIATQSVDIGNDCAISWGAQILDDDLHALFI